MTRILPTSRALRARQAAMLPCAALSLSLLSWSAMAAELAVTVANVVPNGGMLQMSVHSNDKNFKADTGEVASQAFGRVAQASAPASGTSVTVRLELPPGAYSVSVYQDTNNNGLLDTNLFGVPQEAYGFSNNARGLFGKPDFADVLVQVDGDRNLDIDIE